jgi:acetyl esterase/lipase
MFNRLRMKSPVIRAAALSSVFIGSPLAAQRSYPPEIEGAQVEVYKSVGGFDLRLWIFAPDGHTAESSSPAIIFFFGGGWLNGSPEQFVAQSKYFAERGMVAMVADYRVKSRNGVQAVKCVEDAKSAIRWARANAARLGIDPDRLVAGGGSAGGHLAASCGILPLYDNPEEDLSISSQRNALALFNPVLVVARVENMLPQDEDKLKNLQQRLGVEPSTLSPYHNLRAGLPPAIIFHGTDDTTVPYASIQLFVEQSKEFGNRCELVTYEGEGHGFFNHGRKQNQPFNDTVAKLDAFLVSLGYPGEM